MTLNKHLLSCLMLMCGLPGLVACVAPLAAPGVAPVVAPVLAPPVKGEVLGSQSVHTSESRKNLIANAQVALPAIGGGQIFLGKWRDVPASASARFPVVLFLHGSSGLGLAAIAEWQRWLAAQGIASVAPDSFALPDRLSYKSPVDKSVYERIHSLRASEITAGLEALRNASWADASRVLLSGTSEGAVAVARYKGAGIVGRAIYAWSCEDNYMVFRHDTGVPPGEPVLNVISLSDPFFSPTNAWLASPTAMGHCGAAFAGHKTATVVLIAGAPHTLLNLPATRAATQGFLRETFQLK